MTKVLSSKVTFSRPAAAAAPAPAEGVNTEPCWLYFTWTVCLSRWGKLWFQALFSLCFLFPQRQETVGLISLIGVIMGWAVNLWTHASAFLNGFLQIMGVKFFFAPFSHVSFVRRWGTVIYRRHWRGSTDYPNSDWSVIIIYLFILLLCNGTLSSDWICSIKNEKKIFFQM